MMSDFRKRKSVFQISHLYFRLGQWEFRIIISTSEYLLGFCVVINNSDLFLTSLTAKNLSAYPIIYIKTN